MGLLWLLPLLLLLWWLLLLLLSSLVKRSEVFLLRLSSSHASIGVCSAFLCCFFFLSPSVATLQKYGSAVLGFSFNDPPKATLNSVALSYELSASSCVSMCVKNTRD